MLKRLKRLALVC